MKLSIIHANSRTKLTLNEENEVTLGRGVVAVPGLEDDAKLSRQHLKLYFDDENKCFVVRDLESTNGSFLNHDKLDTGKAYQIHVGDIIVFGNQTLEIETIWDDSKILKNTTGNTGKPSLNLDASITQEMTTIDHSALYRQFSYEGTAKELLVLVIKNVFFSLITLGIYIPYAKVNLRKHIWSYTKFGPDNFNFAGTGWELLRSYIIFFGLVAAIGGGFWGISSYFGLNWFDFIKNFTDGLRFEAMGLVFSFLFISGIILLFYMAFIFYMQFGTMRYLLTRTKLRGLYFNLDRTRRLNFIVSSLGGLLLSVLTLGFYYPYFKAHQISYLWGYAHYGDQQFNFTGQGKSYAVIFVKTFIFAITVSIAIKILDSFLGVLFDGSIIGSIIVLILSYSTYFLVHSYFKAESLNYLINNLGIQDAHFASRFTMGQMLRLNSINYLIIIATFGLAAPIVFIRNMSYYAKKIEVHGSMDFEIIEMSPEEQGGEFAEVLADVFDFELSW